MADRSRRDALKSAAALLTLAGWAPTTYSRERALNARNSRDAGESADAPSAPSALTLWYQQPARQWVEALPVGTGRLGAMVFGGTQLERLQLNEDTLYAGGPYDPDSPEAHTALPEVRRLIAQGQYAEAEALANEKLMGRPLKQMAYQPIGDLLLNFPGIDSSGIDATSEYRRELDLDQAVARTHFVCEGVRHVREVFASAVDQVIVVRLSAEARGKINVDLSLTSPQKSSVSVASPDVLTLSGVARGMWGIEGVLKFQTRVKVIVNGDPGAAQGHLSASADRLRVRGADEAVLIIAAATSFRRYDDIGADPDALASGQIATAAHKPFARLLADHVAEHHRLFRRVSIDLGNSDAASLPTDERVRQSAQLDDPALAALYYQYGRYLLICSSRPGSQPANLQGIWNDRTDPPWESKWTININTQMNYWPAESVNLGECVLPLITMVTELSETGARTAKAMYGARGWVVHNNTDIWRATAPVDGAKWSLWPTGGAWLCRHLWDHYDYGRDPQYLARIYQVLKGAAEFFLDTLVEEPALKQPAASSARWLVTSPSLSPENVHPHGASICAGPAMDRQILRDLFANCIEAATLLGVDAELRARLQEARQRLAPDRIGAAGQLQEWLEDWDLSAPEIHHRHVSHLYAVYPSSQINIRDTPELVAAARKSLELRGDEATGWGIGWRLNLWARLHDAERAHKVLRMLLRPERTYPNLFDAHPPFQIDGNFGGTAGITEMLLQSWGGVIHLLPALPAAWRHGSVTGLRARGGCTLDIAWADGQLSAATLHTSAGGQYLVRYAGKEARIDLAKAASARLQFP
jgi:alpha-L-fucosidase 2